MIFSSNPKSTLSVSCRLDGLDTLWAVISDVLIHGEASTSLFSVKGATLGVPASQTLPPSGAYVDGRNCSGSQFFLLICL